MCRTELRPLLCLFSLTSSARLLLRLCEAWSQSQAPFAISAPNGNSSQSSQQNGRRCPYPFFPTGLPLSWPMVRPGADGMKRPWPSGQRSLIWCRGRLAPLTLAGGPAAARVSDRLLAMWAACAFGHLIEQGWRPCLVGRSGQVEAGNVHFRVKATEKRGSIGLSAPARVRGGGIAGAASRLGHVDAVESRLWTEQPHRRRSREGGS